MTSWNLADLFEQTAGAVPDRTAARWPGGARTYSELAERSRSVGAGLRSSALPGRAAEPGEHVAILSWNRIEWLEAMLGCFAGRLAPINVNYRYVDDEVRYLLDNSDAVAIVVEPEFLPMVRRLRAELPLLRRVVVLGDEHDGPVTADLDADAGELGWDDLVVCDGDELTVRSPDDPYVLYTGGTTGMPKGVMWRSEDIWLGAISGGRSPERPESILDMLSDAGPWLVTSPFMHGNGQWNSIRPLIEGSGVSLWTARGFDADGVIDQAEAHGAWLVVLVGDGMARPFADALSARVAAGRAPDLQTVGALASGGAILSPVVKAQLAELLPHVRIVDGFGASESGGNGALIGPSADGAPRFMMNADTMVLDDELMPTTPGDGVMGRLGRTGNIPLGYYKDPEKTAATFPTGPDGRRWAIPGDAARWEADGTIAVFGRGSNCINTGGEKVFPEEVEAVVKSHPEVENVFVLGRADERFGQRVAAVIARRPDSTIELEAIRAFCRGRLAGYKLPREAVFVPELQFTGPGKPDYAWAKAQFDDGV